MSGRPTIVPITRLLHVESTHNLQSPGIPSHTQMREPQSAMRRQEQPPVQGFRVPAVQWKHEPEWPTRNSGKRGPMRPAPLTSGGLALEEITCRGWGPHLQYTFLIKLASLSGKYPWPQVNKILHRPKHFLLCFICCGGAVEIGETDFASRRL